MMNKANGVSAQASVPMKLFATWEIDRSAANCIPRICTMTICKLTVLRELDKDVQSVFIAVKMQGSKRIFRSNEIFLGGNGLVDTTLELTFSLEYPHFVKRDENKLQILLQRRKRYKNRAMLGFKTLAVCRVDMSALIQCPLPDDTVLQLLAVRKDQDTVVSIAAHIVVASMSSVPVDADVDGDRMEKQETERSPEADNSTEDDEETTSSDPDNICDIPQTSVLNPEALWEFDGDEAGNQKRKGRRKVRMSSSSRQQNFIKSKVVALLKKFRQVADEDLDPTLEPDQDENPDNQVDYDFLYDDLEDFNLSDSCPEVDDNISIVSTPKPKLKPFFDRTSYSSSHAEITSYREQPEAMVMKDRQMKKGGTSWQEVRAPALSETRAGKEVDTALTGCISSPSSSPEIKVARSHHVSGDKGRVRSGRDVVGNDREFSSTSTSRDSKTIAPPTDTVNNFLTRLENEDGLPEIVLLADGNDKQACSTAFTLASPSVGLPKPVLSRSSSEVQSLFVGFLTRLQKFLNRNSLPLLPVKFAIVGTNVYLNVILRHFVEFLSSRSPEWQALLLFYIVPTGSTRISRYLSSIDPRYNSLFGETTWKESCDANLDSRSDEVFSKLRQYFTDTSQVLHMAIAEAMLTFRQRGSDEVSSQKFLPFISEVRVGENDVITVGDSDKEDTTNVTNTSSTMNHVPASAANAMTPPSPPSVAAALPITGSLMSTMGTGSSTQVTEVKLGLQVDYWKERDATKYTLKTNFKSFHVACLPQLGERAQNPSLVLDVVTMGKKNLMRLPGKKGKEKEAESKSHAVGNINRLICTSKHQNSLLQVSVDGVEWKDVKFFQLSAHWSSHIKTFPVAIFPNT